MDESIINNCLGFLKTFKLKTAEGEVKVAVLGDSPGREEYLQHINSFLRNLTRRKWDAKMTKSIRAVQLATASMTKFAKVPANETGAMTAMRSASLAAAVEKRKEEAKKSGEKPISPTKKPKTEGEDLKLVLSSKFTSALVTHCHMGQAKAENMFDTIYKNATAKEEN